MYGHNNPTYLDCVKNWTGSVITFSDYPVLRQSKLQTKTALLTTEEEIADLAHNYRYFFPLIDKTKSLVKQLWLSIGETEMNLSINEDNYGALILENTLPPQFTPRSKNYADKTIWFCEEIVKCGINLCKIDAVDQLDYIFTKVLTRVTFDYLWKKLMGW